MPFSGSRWRRVQFKSVIFLKRGSGLKPFDAGPNQKLANSPQGQAKILDMGPQGSILWVIFDTSLCSLVSQVVAYYTKFLILIHAIVQLGVSLNFYAIDSFPTYVIHKLMDAGPQIRMHSPPIAKGLLRLVVKGVNHIGVIRVESIHTIVRDSMLEVHVESI